MISLAIATVLTTAPPAIGSRVEPFHVQLATGMKIDPLAEGDSLHVLIFLGTECPLSRLYVPTIAKIAARFDGAAKVVIVAPQPSDSAETIRTFEGDYHLGLTIVRDSEQEAADALGVDRVPEAVLVDSQRRIRYRGRIDDRYRLAAHRAAAQNSDLEDAIEAVLGGREVATAETKAEGCPIEHLHPHHDVHVPTWSDSVASIIHRRCDNCHAPGRIGPFPLTSHREVVAHAAGIAEVLADGRMPPWHADPRFGKFANDMRLSKDELDALGSWLKAGCPAGDLSAAPALHTEQDGWEIGRPDVVVSMPVEFNVPADGVVEYQYFEVPVGFSHDVWVEAAEIRPGNRAVVHHCNIYLKPPGAAGAMTAGPLGSFCLAATTQGTRPMELPPGTAKRIPAGWNVQFIVHYAPIGKPQTDRTSLGLRLVDPSKVRKEIATQLLLDPDLMIPPNVADYRTHKEWKAPADVLLYAFFPHMHLRGKAFEYAVEYPSGEREILLSVPKYDFAWQHRYVLAEPKKVPRGSVLHCTATYDNSAANVANPNPNVTVKAGGQSTDEMFNAYFDWALAEQDLIAENTLRGRLARICTPELSVLLLFVAAGVFIRAQAREQRRRQSASASIAAPRSDIPV